METEHRPNSWVTLIDSFFAVPPPRIVVADHDETNLARMAQALSADGHRVLPARDGFELLEVLAHRLLDDGEPVDMVIADLHIPGWNGMQVLAGLRAVEWPTPIVLMADRPVALARAKKLGAAAILLKPFDLDDLRTVVLNLLPRRIPDQPHDGLPS